MALNRVFNDRCVVLNSLFNEQGALYSMHDVHKMLDFRQTERKDLDTALPVDGEEKEILILILSEMKKQTELLSKK